MADSTKRESSGKRSGKANASSGSSRSSGSGRMSALDAAQAVREQLQALLGKPVEAVLGAERDGSGWIVKAQVVELERIPSTTDVLGEYETEIDKGGEVVRYARIRRYPRGQVDGQG